LSEACNYIACAFCGTGFCFVCGSKEDESSEHWSYGGCPRYNQHGDPNAEFDGPALDSDDEESVPDEESGAGPVGEAEINEADSASDTDEEDGDLEGVTVNGVKLGGEEKADNDALWRILSGG